MKAPRAKIKVDLSDWEVAGWAERLADCVSVETSKTFGEIEVTITFNADLFEAAARQIGTEMIEAFFERELLAQAIATGVRLYADDIVEPATREILIPWESDSVSDVEIADDEVAKRLAEQLGRGGELMNIPLEEIMGWVSSRYRRVRG